MDYTGISGAVDWTAVITAGGSIAVALAGVYVAFKGAKLALRFLRGA